MKEGNLYRILIDPLLKNVHKKAAEMITVNSSVIDIACGNGTLAMIHATNASKVVGIDLSGPMIEYARSRAEANKSDKIEFICMDANDLSSFSDQSFDFGTISMAVHQFNPDVAIAILKQMKRIAKHLVIIDYAFPLPGGFKGYATRIIERIAGEEHNRNFLKYLEMGGVSAIMSEVSPDIALKIERAGSVFEVATTKI